MIKKCFILVLFILIFCISCQNNNEVLQDTKELVIYDYNEPLTYGVFNISKRFGIDDIKLFFIKNDYYLDSFPVDFRNDVKIISINGTNTDFLNVDLDDFGECSEYKDYRLGTLYINVKTNSDDFVDTIISSVDVSIDGIEFTIKTDLLFHIKPDCEFIQDENGTQLLNPFNTDYFSTGVYKSDNSYSIDNQPAEFSAWYYFGNLKNCLFEESDYLVINRIIIDTDDFTNCNNNYFTVDEESYRTYEQYKFTDEVIGLKANHNEYYHNLFGFTVNSSIDFKKIGIHYISLSIEYYFSYDDTIKTICLGSFRYNDFTEILKYIYK